MVFSVLDLTDSLEADLSCSPGTLILIQQDLFSSQNVSKAKDASPLPGKLATSVSLFDDEDEEVNGVIAVQDK